MTNAGERAPHRLLAVAAMALAAGLAGHQVEGASSNTSGTSPTSGPPSRSGEPVASEPAATTTTAPTTVPPLAFESGTFTAPDGSFAVAFTSMPRRVIDADNEVDSYLLGVEEDTQSVVIFRPTALGATPDATPSERADLFLSASGTDIEPLANTETRLGPFGAAHFIARLTLTDDRRAVVYGLEVTREKDVIYVFYTDVGGDDNDAGSVFVESFALLMEQPPAPTTSTTTTTTVPASDPAPSTAMSAVASSAAPTTGAPALTVSAPEGATVAYDSRWWVTFPEGAAPAFRASTSDGFAYAEYLAVDGDDTLIVRATDVPVGYEWLAADVPDAAAGRVGGVVQEFEVVDMGGHEAVRFTLARDDSDTSRDTVQMLVVNGGTQIYTISFEDGGVTSTDDADAFIESFELTS